jgi:hypothetical protein
MLDILKEHQLNKNVIDINKQLIKTIEKATKIKFNKPYYTRENSIPYKGKSFNYITEHIKKI